MRKEAETMAAASVIIPNEETLRERIKGNLKHLEKMGISKEMLEFAQIEYKLLGNKYSSCHKRKSSTNNNDGRSYSGRIVTDDQRFDAVRQAEKFQRNSKDCHPSFTKPMLRSHVSGCFWLNMPRRFCENHLPEGELQMILEDEEGKEYESKYLARKSGLSGGWRGFSLAHDLEDGDALVFQLIAPARFKVYIMKAIQEESDRCNDNEGKTVGTSSTNGEHSIMQKEILPASGKKPTKSGSAMKKKAVKSET